MLQFWLEKLEQMRCSSPGRSSAMICASEMCIRDSYTSGSTGQPKGVIVDHCGAVNTILDINDRFGVGPQDRVLALSRLNFDLSVYDIFGLLAAGGTIVMPSPELAQDTTHWAQLVAGEKITLWNTVPALMGLLVEQAEHGEPIGQSLRVIMMSGDWVPVGLPGQIRKLLPKATLMRCV